MTYFLTFWLKIKWKGFVRIIKRINRSTFFCKVPNHSWDCLKALCTNRKSQSEQGAAVGRLKLPSGKKEKKLLSAFTSWSWRMILFKQLINEGRSLSGIKRFFNSILYLTGSQCKNAKTGGMFRLLPVLSQ